MQAAIWCIPSTADFTPGEDNLSSAPALELQTRIDSSSYGDVKRYAVCTCAVIVQHGLTAHFCMNILCNSVTDWWSAAALAGLLTGGAPRIFRWRRRCGFMVGGVGGVRHDERALKQRTR